MYLPNDKSKLFCLEQLPDSSLEEQSKTLPYLEELAKRYGLVNVYKSCECIDTFEASLDVLLYEDRNFQDYDLLYFVFNGVDDYIVLDRYTYSLQEIAERFEGKLTDKIVHFSNKKALNLDEEACQYFIDVTGVKAVSGYSKQHLISSTPLDMTFFGLYDADRDVRDLVEQLFEKNYKACTELGFHLYY